MIPQGWCIEADLDSTFVRLKLFFMDLHSVPRNHLRYISWIAYIIARDPKSGLRESIVVANSPHSNYYIQDGIDMGVMMDTTLPVAKVRSINHPSNQPSNNYPFPADQGSA